MASENPHVGSTFESWLDETGLHEEVTAAAIEAIVAHQLAAEMKQQRLTKQRLTKKRMAELMQTSRAQLDRLLDPDNGSVTIESLQRAAKLLGRRLRIELA